MATTQYIGSRYVPVLADPVEWSSTKTYEPLTIVTHEGNSYTSRQFVPIGVDIDNETYWVLTGNYNAQIEQYRRETAQAVAHTDAAVAQVDEWLTDAQSKYGEKPFAFDTVADMQDAYEILYVGAICHTNGFHTSGDKGAAYYKISASGTDNGRDVLALRGGLFAHLIVTGAYLTPTMFGAYGDGTHDDTAAFIAALQSNDCLFIPDRQYLITEIPLSHGKHVLGTGTIVINGNGFVFNCPTERKIFEGITFEISNAAHSCIKTTGKSNDAAHETLTIKDVTFNGVENSKIIAVEIGADTDAKVLNCDFNGCGLNVINSINPIVSDCVFQGGYYGIYNANTDSASGRAPYACGLRLSSCTILGCIIGIKVVEVDSVHIVNCMVDYDDYPLVILGTNNPILADSYFSSRKGNIAIYIGQNNSDSGVFGGNGFNTETTRDLKISNCVALIHGETLNNECVSLHKIRLLGVIDGLTIEYAGKAGICLYDCLQTQISNCSIRSNLSGAYAIDSYVNGVQGDDSSCKYTAIQSDLPIYTNYVQCPIRPGIREYDYTTTEAFSANTWYVIANISDIMTTLNYADVLSVTFGGGTYAYGAVSLIYSSSNGNIRVCGTQNIPTGTLLKLRIAYKRSSPKYN